MTKFIRTGEGVLVFVFNIALLVVPIVSNGLTAAESAKWATIIDGVAVISRTGLKIVASAQSAKPAATTVLPAPVADEVAAAPPAALTNGAPPADGAGVPAQVSEVVTPQVAAVGTDIADMGQLVADSEEFADTPSAAQSEPDQQPDAALPSGTAGLVGSNSNADSPFLAQLGG
jgi:hypothetical protein